MSSNEPIATSEPIEPPNGNLTEDAASLAIRPTSSEGPSVTRTSFQSHGRALSMATESVPTATRSNRFSVHFPIQTAGLPPRTSISPVREQQITTETPETPSVPSDGNYLHLVAAQERRVLELREELQRAEADLNKLKRDWARHEATKKREDVRRSTRLEPLQTSSSSALVGGAGAGGEDDLDGSSAWMQQEMERRKALMSANKTSSRTVFPGQRHTRALSLLSPRGEGPAPRLPPRKESLQNPVRQSAEESRPLVLKPRSSTTSELAHEEFGQASSQLQQQVLDHDALLRAGKKYATDFKDGLWTFWEDIRQATVGEESAAAHPHPHPPPRKKSSTQTLKSAKKQSSRGSLVDSSSRSSSTVGKGKKKAAAAPLPDLADPSFWTDHGIPAPPAPASTRKSPVLEVHNHTESSVTATSNESWDAWDDNSSPIQSRSSSSVTSENTTLPSTVSGSPRPSMSTNRDSNRDSRDLCKKEAIPWPALQKSGFGTLRRTASHLLSEWERSLTPSPGQQWTGQEDFMGASAEAAAFGATTGGGGGKGKGKGKHD